MNLTRNPYKRYLHTKAWKQKRKGIFKIKGRRCSRCGRPATQVNHETYKRLFHEKVKDLEPICKRCNKQEKEERHARRRN